MVYIVRRQKIVVGSSAPSGTSLRTRVLNWSQYITYLTPCLKPDKTGFMFDYTCENKHPRKMSPATKSEGKRMFSQARLCSIGKIWGWVRLSSITEPNRSQSNDWSSIGFDYRAFTRCTLLKDIKFISFIIFEQLVESPRVTRLNGTSR